MGQYIRWQVILAAIGIVLLGAYLSSIDVAGPIAPAPLDTGGFREGLIGNPQYINPLLAGYNPIDQDITALIFEGLVRDDGFGNLLPVLAQSWSVSDDARVYTFILRRDINWSDGQPFSSDDVLFTFQLIQADDFPGDPAWRSLWQSVKIERVDAYQIRFELTEPLPAFPYYTTVGMLPYHILKDTPAHDLLTHPFNLTPMGTGPFKLTEATDQYVRLEPNGRYHQPRPRLERLEFKFYPTADALVEAYRQQEIDGLGRVALPLLQQLLDIPSLQFFSGPLPRYDLIYLNLRDAETYPFFRDHLVRQALFQAIDRQHMIDQVLSGQAILAKGPFLPWSWAFNPGQNYPDYNPTGAQALFDQAGWVDSDGDSIRDKEGVPLKFALLTDTSHSPVAEELARQWGEFGLAVQVETIQENLAGRLTGAQFEAVLLEVQLFGDPDPYAFWHQSQIDDGQNFAGWDNSEASEALEAARMTIDRGERIKDYYQFQAIFAEEMPALILYHPVSIHAVRDTVKNVQMSALTTASDRFRNVQDWYILPQVSDPAAAATDETALK